jgi:FkbM family methyltransferase
VLNLEDPFAEQMNKLEKIIRYFPYYLEIFSKRLNGKGRMNPAQNGEYRLLRNALKVSGEREFVYIDGGANTGENVLFLSGLQGENRPSLKIVAVEPVPETYAELCKNLSSLNVQCINVALGDKVKSIDFFVDSDNFASGSNSVYGHYYLENARKVSVSQVTIDSMLEECKIAKVNFLKLDIEGSELSALEGARKSIGAGLIDYIQIEYNQTWIAAKISLLDVFKFFAQYDYTLYRIAPRELLRISAYHYTLDDFYFSNILAVRSGCALPLKCLRDVSPLVDSSLNI